MANVFPFPLNFGKKAKISILTSSIQLFLENHIKQYRKTKINKIWIEKQEVKLSLFEDDMIVVLENYGIYKKND